MENRNELQPQYCCWIELRLGCIIAGFIGVILAFITLAIHIHWDTCCNVILSCVCGISIISGAFRYHKESLLVYLSVEIIHIVVMSIGAIDNWLEMDENQKEEKDKMLYLGFVYVFFIFIHLYFWKCAYRLYKRYKSYRFLPGTNS